MSAEKKWPFHHIDEERPISFACLGTSCPQTCCGPFHGTRAVKAVMGMDDLGIALDPTDASTDHASIFAQIRLTDEDVRRIRDAGLDHLMVYRGDPSSPHYYLRLDTDGSCAALTADHLCSIHPHRPTICRAFPFYFDLFAGLSMIEACPGVGSETQPARLLREEIEAATKMYRFWLDETLG